MSKIKLSLDDLSVESFSTAAGQNARGTVDGHDATERASACPASCQGTCDTDCYGPCDNGPYLTNGCYVTQTCSQDRLRYTLCDISCEVECPSGTCG